MIKYFLLFLIAAQSMCFSENIKFYIFDAKHGSELKPDSVILENVTTKKRIYALSETFVGSSPDFKAKAKIINNYLNIEIDNSGSNNLEIDLYGYSGSSLFSENISVNFGVNRKNISLENIYDKLFFLSVKSAKTIQYFKFNRTVPDLAYLANPIFKQNDEILGGNNIDTSFKYNLYVYKNGYRKYSDINISFNGKKYYVAKLEEKTPAEKITNSSFKLHGITVISSCISYSYCAPNPSTQTQKFDTTKYDLSLELHQNIKIEPYSSPRCRPFTNELGSEYIEVCEGVGNNYSSNKNIVLIKWLWDTGKIEGPIYNPCSERSEWQSQYEQSSYINFKLTGQYSYESIGSKNYLRFDKAGIQKLINSKALNFNFSSRESQESSASLYHSNTTDFVSILSISDDAYIEFAFWE